MNRHAIFFEPPAENNFLGHIFEEVYKSGLYQPFIPTNPKNSVVIDAGANIGITAYFFHDKFEKVYAIEPSTNHFETINEMLKFNDIKNVFPFQFALSAKDGESEFYHYANRTMNSLYGNLQGVPQTGNEKVPLKRLDTFMTEQKIDHVNLFKCDIEGVEFEVLCGEGFSNVADKIDAVIGEVHDFSGRHPNQIKDALEQHGFKFTWMPHDAHLFAAKK